MRERISGLVAGRREAAQLLMRQGLGTEEALVPVAAPFPDESQLLGAFHSLDHDLEAELLRQADEGAGDDPIAFVPRNSGDQAAVDLDHVEGERGEIAKA